MNTLIKKRQIVFAYIFPIGAPLEPGKMKFAFRSSARIVWTFGLVLLGKRVGAKTLRKNHEGVPGRAWPKRKVLEVETRGFTFR